MKILVLSFSQSGQLNNIINRILSPLKSHSIEFVDIIPKESFPFPWSSLAFFDIMPDCVLEHPIEFSLSKEIDDSYDLVVLGSQPWFLSPSLPVTSLLKSEQFGKAVKNKPVLMISGARNMWLNAQISINKGVKAAGGEIVGNIPVCDTTNNYISALTIVYWMFTAKKDKMFGLFPVPGVQPKEFDKLEKYGEIIDSHIENNDLSSLQTSLVDNGAVKVPIDILFIERKAKRIFKVWANIIDKSRKKTALRRVLINLFIVYLIIALFIVAPILLLIYYVLFLPFTIKKLNKDRKKIKMSLFESLRRFD